MSLSPEDSAKLTVEQRAEKILAFVDDWFNLTKEERKQMLMTEIREAVSESTQLMLKCNQQAEWFAETNKILAKKLAGAYEEAAEQCIEPTVVQCGCGQECDLHSELREAWRKAAGK